MNPPPPLYPPPIGNPAQLQAVGALSVPTLALIMMITFTMQGSLILFSTLVIKAYKGVREAAIATFLIGFSFLAIRIGNELDIERIHAGFVSSLSIASGFYIFYLAICKFTERPAKRWLSYGFVPLGYLVFIVVWLLRIRELPMQNISAIMILVLNTASVLTLFNSDTRRYQLAAYLTGFPLLTYGLIALGRMVFGIIEPSQVAPGQSFSAIFDVLSLFIFSYFWSAGFILMISQRLQSDLNDLAMNDALTRVHNRRAMQDMLNFEMSRIETEVREFSIILLDVDYFKKVNDTYGHDVGDVVLQWLASSLQNLLRVQDVIARWGGEEFLILLPDTSLDEGMEIAERLRATVDTSLVETEVGPLHITFSGGVSNSNSTRHVGELCKVADQALYIAKRTRNKVVSENEIEVTISS